MSLVKQFEKMGVRVKIDSSRSGCVLNIRNDKKGEYFDIQKGPNVDVAVVDLRPKERHLLLSVNEDNKKSKFLCGHDERHWFVAAIPEKGSNVYNVDSAMDALKPKEVHEAQRKANVRNSKKNRRHNKGYIRQGEWFFLPDPNLKVDDSLILKNEPIRRGRGKPHNCEELYRTGGETVWVCSRYPNGLTEAAYKKVINTPGYNHNSYRWQVMRRDALVYVRGKITHKDHATITLPCWHKVVMNTETNSRAMAQMAFLD